MNAIEEKLSRAKAQLVLGHPFFASIICAMPMEEVPDMQPPTMGTNGKRIIYHPEFVKSLSQDELLFVLCHEVAHCVFAHMFRRGNRHPVMWNIAGDLIINDMLIRDGVGRCPNNALVAGSPALVAMGIPADILSRGGYTTDGVYSLIPDQPRSGQGKGEGGGWSTDDQFDNCEDHGGDAAEQAQAEAEMKVTIAQAANAAKNCGKLGSNLARMVDQALKPKVNWRDVLRRFISHKAKIEYTYAKPKRRFLVEDLYLPTLAGNALGELCVAVDCSGSISNKEINEFAAELRAIKDDCRPHKLNIIYFHHEVSKCDEFGQDDELIIAPNGTGGTAFSPIFNYIAKRGFQPVATIVLTDLCCSDFGPVPEYPVLWVSNHTDQAPWGEVTMMKE